MTNIKGFFEEGLWATKCYGEPIENLLTINQTNYIRRQSRKVYAVRYGGDRCQYCGYTHPLALAFHHNNPMFKAGSISNIIRGNTADNSKKALENEIDICTLVCINCHAETHTHSNSICKKELLRIVGAVDFCLYCGYKGSNIGSLQFHHRDPAQKKFSISSIYNNGNKIPKFTKNIKVIKVELAKCDVICANCHSLCNSHLQRFARFHTQIIEKSYTWEDDLPKKSKNTFKNKKNKRHQRNNKPDPNGNIFGEVDNRSPLDIMKEDYLFHLDGLVEKD